MNAPRRNVLTALAASVTTGVLVRDAETNAAPADEVINAREMGATGDGLTDDTSALQQAIDAAEGGSLYIPPGTYRIRAANSPGSFALTSFSKARRIFGAGAGSTILRLELAGSAGSGALAFTEGTLCGLTIDGGFTPDIGPADLYSVVAANSHTVVENCHIHNARGSCITTNGTDVVIHDNRLEKFGDHAYYASGTLADAAPYDVLGLSSRLVVHANLISDEPSYHNRIAPDGAPDRIRGAIKFRNNVSDAIVTNNIVRGDQCVLVTGDNRRPEALPRRLSISNNQLHCTYSGVTLVTEIAQGVEDGGLRVEEVSISGNTITGSGAGVQLKCARTEIRDNFFTVSTQGVDNVESGDVGRVVMVNNTLVGGEIGFYKPGRGSLIANNVFAGQRRSGLFVHGSHVIAKGNTFSDCETGVTLKTATLGDDFSVLQTNTFVRCATGLNLDANARTYFIEGNTFISNGESMRVGHGATYNRGPVVRNHVLSGAAFPTTAQDGAVLVGSDPVPVVAHLPPASGALRGRLVRTLGGTGVPDGVHICVKDVSDSYTWRTI